MHVTLVSRRKMQADLFEIHCNLVYRGRFRTLEKLFQRT